MLCCSGGWTKLHYAGARGHMQACQLLLDAKANVNTTNTAREIALHESATNGHAQVCQLMIQAKADVNVKGQYVFMFELFYFFCVVFCF
jgi:ankyrin repeat protein